MKAFEVITDRILAALDEGTIPWRKPWKCGGAVVMTMCDVRCLTVRKALWSGVSKAVCMKNSIERSVRYSTDTTFAGARDNEKRSKRGQA